MRLDGTGTKRGVSESAQEVYDEEHDHTHHAEMSAVRSRVDTPHHGSPEGLPQLQAVEMGHSEQMEGCEGSGGN